MKTNKIFIIIITCGLLMTVSCVEHEVSFDGKSEISPDGSLLRTGKFTISISGDRDIPKDSLNLSDFLRENYVIPDDGRFGIAHKIEDSVLTLTWQGTIDPNVGPVSDYIHKSGEGQRAVNEISVSVLNRWIYKDIIYLETFSDPVDTLKYFPLIEDGMSAATETILGLNIMKGLGDREEAEEVLRGIETTAGLELFKQVLAEPDMIDSVSNVFDEYIEKAADSLAGFRGVKLAPDSLEQIIHSVFDAAWDSLFTDYPGIFGSFGIEDLDAHNFIIEVKFPGCLISSNANVTSSNASVWSFDRMDFFAREFSMELKARQWAWLNVAIAVIVLALILFGIFWPFRKKR